MQERITRLLPALAVVVALMGGPLAASVVFGQQKELGTKADQYPDFFKMYGKDGRDSLTASCTPIDLKPIVNQVTCKFIHVRFDLPGKRPGEIDMPLSVEEAVKTIPGLAEEVRKNPKKLLLRPMFQPDEADAQPACRPLFNWWETAQLSTLRAVE